MPLAVVAALVVVSATPVPAQTRAPRLEELLRRVGAYVQAYGQKASLVVGTEHYAQHLTTGTGEIADRHLVAEFAIVNDEKRHEWLGFRDVIQVDGKPITDHEQRLVEILTSRTSGFDEARTLSDEGARFNLGQVYRNFNVPTTALFFFKPVNLDRFKFSEGARAPDGSIGIEFREKEKPTIIRAASGGSVPSRGQIWVDPATGTITRTRLRLDDLRAAGGSGNATVEVDVTYALVDRFGMWLPQTMREAYDAARNGTAERETGRADYSNYREYQVSARIK